MKVGIFHVTSICRVVLVWVLVSGCGDSKESRLQTFLERGNASLAQSDGEQAIYYYQQAIKLDSCYADAWNNIGTVHFNSHRMEEALHHYDRALACDPGFMEAYFNRSNTQFQLHNYEAALADLDRILVAKPDTAVAYFSLGLALTELGRFDEAITSFNKAAKLDTALRVDGLINIATVKIRMKKYDEAEAELKTTLRQRPGEPNIYNSLALISTAKGDLDEALTFVNRALSIVPDQPYFLNNRGYIFLSRNEFDLALADIDRSMTIDPYNGWAFRNKGILYFRKGDMARSERLLEQALLINENIDHVHYYLGMTYINQGKAKEGCGHVRLSEARDEGMVTAEDLRKCPLE